MDDLVYKVIEWGREHKIDNPVMQALKVNEEVGEIATEITHGRLRGPDMVDAIGDSLVTIIILADILGYDPANCLQEAYDVISKRKGETKDGCFIKEDNVEN
jgi:NTP pyrophosphatase (non-canonical NTP hydrolase)